MNTFLINNKRYIAKELTFGAVRHLEGNGISLGDMGSKPFSLASGYLSFCAGISMKAADEEIEKHVISGGNLDGLYEAVTEAMNNSRFFQALNKKEEIPEPTQETTYVPITPPPVMPVQEEQTITAFPVGEAPVQ